MSDRKVGDTFYHHFSTRAFGTGIPTTLIGTPVAEAYEDANATGITAGVSLTIDHAETGHHLLTIVATGANGFETGKSYGVSLTAGTVDGVSVVGEVIWNFTLGMSPAFKEIGTAGAGLTAIPATVDWLDGGRLDIILDTIAGDVVNLDGAAMRGTDGANTTTPLTAAQVNAEVDTALVDIGLDHLISAADGDNPVDGSIIAHMVSATEDWSTFVPSTDSLEAIRNTAPLGTAMRGTDSALTDKAGFSLSATGLDAIGQAALGMVEIAKAIWDRALTGALHNIPTSAGKRLREIDEVLVLDSGTAQAGANGSITLEAGSNANDGFFDDTRLVIVEGTGAGQARLVYAYDGTTLIALTAPDWVVNPDDTSKYDIESQSLVEVYSFDANAKAEINFEMLDVMTVDAIPELSQAQPSATPTFATAIMLPYMALRNKLDIDATEKQIHDAAGTVISKKVLSDDATTYSEALMVTGP